MFNRIKGSVGNVLNRFSSSSANNNNNNNNNNTSYSPPSARRRGINSGLLHTPKSANQNQNQNQNQNLEQEQTNDKGFLASFQGMFNNTMTSITSSLKEFELLRILFDFSKSQFFITVICISGILILGYIYFAGIKSNINTTGTQLITAGIWNWMWILIVIVVLNYAFSLFNKS